MSVIRVEKNSNYTAIEEMPVILAGFHQIGKLRRAAANFKAVKIIL